MKINIYNLIAIFFLSVIISSLSAQKIYNTRAASMVIKISYSDTSIIAISNHVNVILNYETSDIRFKVPYESIRTGIDSIDFKLQKLKNQWMEYKGKLTLPYIITKKHPIQSIEVDGTMLYTTTPVYVKAKGTLIHVPSDGGVSCRLTLKMQFSLSALNIQEVFLNSNDHIEMNILLAILKSNND